MTAAVAPIVPLGSHAWWTSPHPDSELAASIEKFIAAHGEDAWIEVRWLYRTAGSDETHAFVDDAVDHMHRRDTWLHDPRHASDLYDDIPPQPGCLYHWSEQQAEAEEQQLRDLILGWVRSHEASRP